MAFARHADSQAPPPAAERPKILVGAARRSAATPAGRSRPPSSGATEQTAAAAGAAAPLRSQRWPRRSAMAVCPGFIGVGHRLLTGGFDGLCHRLRQCCAQTPADRCDGPAADLHLQQLMEQRLGLDESQRKGATQKTHQRTEPWRMTTRFHIRRQRGAGAGGTAVTDQPVQPAFD